MAATNRITYKQFDALLQHLGFDRARVESKWLRYEHPASQLVIVVAAKEPSELVRVTDAVSARRHLVERGVVSAEQLDELLARDSAPQVAAEKV
jgi:predicted RNA binding protein YcfA (HicA-like mRNA interferase family)